MCVNSLNNKVLRTNLSLICVVLDFCVKVHLV